VLAEILKPIAQDNLVSMISMTYVLELVSFLIGLEVFYFLFGSYFVPYFLICFGVIFK
jgi:hypothetical protein